MGRYRDVEVASQGPSVRTCDGVILARFLLIVALLAGWQSALVHPVAHVDERGALVHLGHADGEHGSASGELCDVLSALTACASVALAVFDYEDSQGHISSAPRFEPRRAQAPPFLSQAPPVLL